MIALKIICTCVLVLTLNRCAFDAVTSSNPCDPGKQVAAHSVFRNELIKRIKDLDVSPSWFDERLLYVNCSRRGLTRIPSTIPWNVQHLDLSSNTIGHLDVKDLEKFVDLQILRLYSNCIGDLPYSQHFCSEPGIREKYDENSFVSLNKLRLLDLGGNAFVRLPPNLPKTLEFLDISRTGITHITKNDVCYLTKLLVFIARNTCFYCNPDEGYLMIDQSAFVGLPLQVVAIHENRINPSVLSNNSWMNIIYLNLATSFLALLQSSLLENLTSIKKLDLHLLNRNKKNIHVKISSGTFDKLKDLEYLDLSCNLIEYLPDNIFRYNTRLSTLDLSGNCLGGKVVLNPVFVPQQITSLYLGYNQCLKDLSQSSIQKLGPVFKNMSNLNVLSFGLPKLIGLATLYSHPLSFHYINNQTFSTILNLSNLSKIIMSDGRVQKIDLTTIHNVQRLFLMDLFNNKILNITSSSVSFGKHCNTSKTGSTKCLYYELNLSNNMLQNLHKTQLVHSKVTHLDLSLNLVSHTDSNLFQYMPCLETIDLTSNPIQFVHDRTFGANMRLKHLFIHSTFIISSDRSLFFLQNLNSYVQVTLLFVDSTLFRLLNEATIIHNIKAVNVTEVELSNNIVPDRSYIENGLLIFQNAISLRLSMCNIAVTDFHLPTSHLHHLDLSHNKITDLSSTILESIPFLETLLFSFNKISLLNVTLFNITPNLIHLDLSHNQITSLFNKIGIRTFQNLRKLELQSNYIFELSTDVFSLSLLSKLEYLDLRWNSIECYCELTLNMGRWLSEHEYYLNERPGFLPVCTYSLNYFGGCVTCIAHQCTGDSLLEQPFVQYATKNYCSNSFNTLLTICYTTFFICFIVAALFFSTSRGMLWMAKFATRRIRLTQTSLYETDTSLTFAFHGFVIFDTEDTHIGDWVDQQLVPQLTKKFPYLKIGVIGKDDDCGFAPTTQLLLKMEASKKVILLLTKDYGQSCHGKYVLSNLEYLSYLSRVDRAVIVTFENDVQVGGLLRKRQKQANMSLLQFPADENFIEIFWENLRHALAYQ